jgi:hypothetical protein
LPERFGDGTTIREFRDWLTGMHLKEAIQQSLAGKVVRAAFVSN